MVKIIIIIMWAQFWITSPEHHYGDFHKMEMVISEVKHLKIILGSTAFRYKLHLSGICESRIQGRDANISALLDRPKYVFRRAYRRRAMIK